MRVAVFSDIHGNYHALEAVLAECSPRSPTRSGASATSVGYGPDPNRCCAAVAALRDRLPRRQPRPRRDRLALGRRLQRRRGRRRALDAGRARRRAREPSSRVSRRAATRRTRRSSTAARSTRSGTTCSAKRRARAELREVGAPLVLVGHSHVALALSPGREAARPAASRPPASEVDARRTARWLLNPGSVGQPRGGDPRAAWLLLDLDGRPRLVPAHRVPDRATQAEIRSAGLPGALAARLALGQ